MLTVLLSVLVLCVHSRGGRGEAGVEVGDSEGASADHHREAEAGAAPATRGQGIKEERSGEGL